MTIKELRSTNTAVQSQHHHGGTDNQHACRWSTLPLFGIRYSARSADSFA